MKKINAFVLFGLVLVSFSACKERVEINEVNTMLLGKWNWVSSVNAFVGATQTPQSTGKVRVLEFLPGLLCREYENGKLLSEKSYQVKKNVDIDTERYAFVMSFDNSVSWTNFSIENSHKLVFNDSYLDGDLTTYERIK